MSILLKRPAAFGAIMFASSALNNVFVTYYLEVFSSLPAWAFISGQCIFALWNASNDPVFGYLSDISGLKRTKAIRYGGWLWCLSFLFIWIPTSSTRNGVLDALHFALSLCLYDGALTFVELNHSALLSDGALGRTQGERAVANAWAATAAGLGSLSSLIAHSCWKGAFDMGTFRTFALCLSIVCCIVFELSYRILEDGNTRGEKDASYSLHGKMGSTSDHSQSLVTKSTTATSSRAIDAGGGGGTSHVPTVRVFLSQIASQPNFLIFSVLSALQVFDCTFEKNFFSQFLSALAPSTISSSISSTPSDLTSSLLPQGVSVTTLGAAPNFINTDSHIQGIIESPINQNNAWLSSGTVLLLTQTLQSSAISLSFFLPHVGTVFFTPFIRSNGLYATIRLIFVFRLILLALVTFIGRASMGPFFVTLFMLTNRVASETVCRLSPLVIADVVDEDAFLHQRKTRLSASIVGSAAFPGKLAQSIAPILGYLLLHSPTTSSSVSSSGRTTNTEDTNDATMTQNRSGLVWMLLLGVPIITVLSQWFLWRSFTLQGAHLKLVKEKAEAEEDIVDGDHHHHSVA
jgi:hypothetical protein